MRTILAMAVVALLTTPCLAQGKLGKAPKQDAPSPSAANSKKKEDGDYKAAIERLPDQKFDPWRNMR
jgi:hypothetical protein